MEIKVTAKAEAQLQEVLHDKEGYLKLKYEFDGPGCSIDGVFALVFASALKEEEISIETNGPPIYIDSAERVFFDDKMIIDYIPEKNRYKLHSPNQILNPRMKIVIN